MQQNYFESKDCSQEANQEVRELMKSLEGNIASFQLSEMLLQKGFPGISFNPTRIRVEQLKNIIREQLPLPAGVQIKETRALNTSNVLTLAAGDQVEVNCSACLYGTHQPVNVKVKGFDGSSRSFLVSADFKRMVRALRLNQPIPSFSDIQNKDLFKEEYVEAVPHTDLITDYDSLRFYKTNKPLRNGELLKRSDLNAISLVKAGLKTEVILESSAIRIKTDGISRNNGSVGEMVEVYHPQKNKKYLGKVIDINKVLVEL